MLEVTEQSVNKKVGTLELGNETVLYSLDPSRYGKKQKPEITKRIRKHKIITSEEHAENQRKALTKILEEMDQKEKDRKNRQKQLKENKEDKDG